MNYEYQCIKKFLILAIKRDVDEDTKVIGAHFLRNFFRFIDTRGPLGSVESDFRLLLPKCPKYRSSKDVLVGEALFHPVLPLVLFLAVFLALTDFAAAAAFRAWSLVILPVLDGFAIER
jgi:hypothetical protein